MNERLIGRGMDPLRASVKVLGMYVRGAVLIFAWELGLYAIAFALLSLPVWPLLALLCALLNMIPLIGSLIGIALVLLISWLANTDLSHLAIAGAVWVGVQAVEGFWLTPRFMGKPLGLRPFFVFVALIAASFLFGPIGILLTIPVLAVAMVWVRYFRGEHPLR